MKTFNLAPFLRKDRKDFSSCNTDFFIALCGPLFMAIFLYGIRAALIIGFCIVTAVFLNAVKFFILSEKRIIDPEDIIISVIIPLLCPATINMLLPSLAVAVAIMCKTLYYSVLKPKAVFLNFDCIGWIFLALIFTDKMFSYCEITALSGFSLSVSSISENSPSVTALIASGNGSKFNLIDLLLGELTGPMGCSSPIVIISCALFLIIRKSAPYEITAGYIISAFTVSALFGGISGCTVLCSSLFEVSGGSLLFCAVFVASRRKYYPLTEKGRWLCGILSGLATVVLRRILPIEQTAPFAILVFSACSEIFDIFSYSVDKFFKFIKVKRYNLKKVKNSEETA